MYVYLRFCLFNLNFWYMAICTPTGIHVHTGSLQCSATSVGLVQACPNYLQGICFSCGFTVSTHSTLCYSSSKIWLLSNIQQAWSGRFGHVHCTCEIQGMCTYWQKCHCSQWTIFILYNIYSCGSLIAHASPLMHLWRRWQSPSSTCTCSHSSMSD